MKRTHEQLKQDIQAAFFGLLIIIIYFAISSYLFSGCKLAGMTIDIQEEVEGDHAQIENETIQGVEFYCQSESIKKCDYFQSGLNIYIRTALPDQWFNGELVPVYGLYEHPLKNLYIIWYDGVAYNSLFHELMHHHKWAYDGKYDHGEKIGSPKWSAFYLNEYKIKDAWKIDQGIQDPKWVCHGGVDECKQQRLLKAYQKAIENHKYCGTR